MVMCVALWCRCGIGEQTLCGLLSLWLGILEQSGVCICITIDWSAALQTELSRCLSTSQILDPQDHLSSLPRQLNSNKNNNLLTSGLVCTTLCDVNLPFQVWDLATDKVGWVGAACRATMVGHMHTVRCLQVIAATMHSVDSSAAC